MGKRLSENERAKITAYANEIGVDLRLADYCTTKEQVDLMLECQNHVDHFATQYAYSVAVAPKHEGRGKKKIDKLLNDTNSEREEDFILSEFRTFAPWSSRVKQIKYEALGYCEDMLRENGFGDKKLKKADQSIMAILHDRLKNPSIYNEPSLSDEEIERISKWLEDLDF